MKIVKIDSENFHFFWKTLGILMKFSGMMWYYWKSQKTQGFILSLADTFFEKKKTQGERQIGVKTFYFLWVPDLTSSLLWSPKKKKIKKIKNLYLFRKNIWVGVEQKIYKTHITKYSLLEILAINWDIKYRLRIYGTIRNLYLKCEYNECPVYFKVMQIRCNLQSSFLIYVTVTHTNWELKITPRTIHLANFIRKRIPGNDFSIIHIKVQWTTITSPWYGSTKPVMSKVEFFVAIIVNGRKPLTIAKKDV